jgi:hypothetical protein
VTTKGRVVVVEPVLEEPLAPAPDGWDGSYSALTVSRAGLDRDHKPVGPGQPCIGYTDPETGVNDPCTLGPDGAPSTRHHFHVAAQLLPDGKTWVGPEGQHVKDLILYGIIQGTAESLERTRRQFVVDLARGTHGTPDNPPGHPDLAERTFEQWLASALGRELAAGPKAMIAKEDGLRASDVRDLQRAAIAQTGAIAELVEELRAGRLAGAGAGKEEDA